GLKKSNPSLLNMGKGGSPLLYNLPTTLSSVFRRCPAGLLEAVTQNKPDMGASVTKVKFHTLA
ncbi:hypothetical protein ACLOJK_022889, partial [Asimina triloba]